MFRPRALKEAVSAGHFALHWDGQRITHWYEKGRPLGFPTPRLNKETNKWSKGLRREVACDDAFSERYVCRVADYEALVRKFEELAKQAEYLFREVEQKNLSAEDAQTVLKCERKTGQLEAETMFEDLLRVARRLDGMKIPVSAGTERDADGFLDRQCPAVNPADAIRSCSRYGSDVASARHWPEALFKRPYRSLGVRRINNRERYMPDIYLRFGMPAWFFHYFRPDTQVFGYVGDRDRVMPALTKKSLGRRGRRDFRPTLESCGCS